MNMLHDIGEHEICVFAPWPLFTVTIERFASGEDQVHFNAGGQAMWVARMVQGLGCKATMVGPLGGESRVVIDALIREEGIGLRSVPTRLPNGGYVNDRRGGSREEIANVRPATLDRHELDDLYNAVLTEGLRCGTVVLTGLPEAEILPPETYGRLVGDLRANGVSVVADIAGRVLEAVDEGLTTLKVSHEELQDAGLARDGSVSEIAGAMEKLNGKADNIVVSRAGDGCLALMKGRFLEAKGPELTPLDPTGAGDSMTAALAVALASGMDCEQALRLAAAAGALNVTRHGRGTGQRRDIDVLAGRVEISEVRR